MYMYLPNIDAVKTGRRIAQLRQERGLSRRHIQEFFGFTSSQAIYKWENGRSIPDISNLVALSWLFETTIEDIIRTDRERGEAESPSPLDIQGKALNVKRGVRRDIEARWRVDLEYALAV